MTINYDEIYISTMREINICKDYIKSYETEIRNLEESLSIKAFEITEEMLGDKKLKKLYETKLALEREKERLKGLEGLLK